VCDPASIQRFATDAEAAAGPIDVIVSNAGDVLPVSTIESTPGEFAQQVAVNLLGPQNLVHVMGPRMVERRSGDVVFISSEVADRARPHMAGYVAAKSGLEGLATAMRYEMEGHGVRVGIIRPGPTSTEQGRGWDADQVNRAIEQWSRHGVMRHAGYLLPDQVASAVMFMVTAARGASVALIELHPEAPVTGEGGQR